jgi:GT2 family glycosyltransferase
MKPSVYIILLNWNQWADTIACLESLFQNDYPDFRVIVVDNHSTNDSVTHIRRWAQTHLQSLSSYRQGQSQAGSTAGTATWRELHSEEIQSLKPGTNGDGDTLLILIKHHRNDGFAGGCNIGLKYISKRDDGDFAMLLNNDTVVSPRFLSGLMDRMRADYRHAIGILSPLILEYHRPDVIWFAGGKWRPWIGLARHMKIGRRVSPSDCGRLIPVSFLSGCAMLIRWEVVEKIGILTDKMFLYSEDIEYGLRVNKAGYCMACDTSAVIWHKERGSSSKSSVYYWRERSIGILYRNFLAPRHAVTALLFQFLIKIPVNMLRKRVSLKTMYRGALAGWFGPRG